MIRRCYSDYDNSYANTIVCDEWLMYNNYLKWYNNNYIKGYHLDKDLKIPGMKVYSPNNCTFVPQEINKIFYQPDKDISSKDSLLPLGVSLSYKKYINGYEKKRYDNKYDAHNGYWNEKYKKVKTMINKFPQFKKLLENYFEYYFNKHYKETV